MKKRTMERRKLEELNLLDNFLFTVTLSHSKYGEEFGRALLQTIFGREFGRLKVVPQKVYYGMNTDKHGIQLDVYLEELRQLLQYMEQTVEENAKNDTLRGFQRIVDEVKKDGEVLKGYMKLWKLEEMWKREGRREEQRKTEEERKKVKEAQNKAERERIRAEKAEEKIRNMKEEIIDIALRMLKAGNYSLEEIANISGLSLNEVKGLSAKRNV